MIYIGADHRGFELKNQLKEWLVGMGYRISDMGASDFNQEDDYPEYASRVAEQVSSNRDNKGIVICGSGVGVDIVANKFDGIRSGLGIDKDQVRSARVDDDINILAIASDLIDFEQAKELVQVFLEAEYKAEERFERRLKEIKEIEQDN